MLPVFVMSGISGGVVYALVRMITAPTRTAPPVSSTDALQAKVQNASLISWCRYSQFVVLLEEDRCLVGGEWLN